MSAPVDSEVTLLPRRAERAFRVGSVVRTGGTCTGSMRTGPWMSSAPGGVVGLGALGVLVDDVLGSVAIGARPAGSVSVSTEISLESVADLPVVDEEVTCVGRQLQRCADGGLAQGEVVGADGRVLAISTQRQRLVPGAFGPGAWAPTEPLTSADVRDPVSLLDATFLHEVSASLRLPGSGDIANPAGNVHGGVSIWASELVGRAALSTADAVFATSSLHIVFLRPLPATATGLVYDVDLVHAGRTFGVARVTGRVEGDPKPRTVTTLTAHRYDQRRST